MSDPDRFSVPQFGPEQWLGGPDPVQSFGNTVEQALQRLTIELAGLRAERDGLRLELEGIRTQLELTQQQLQDRDRFAATVRELNLIVAQLQVPQYQAPQYPPQGYAPSAYQPAPPPPPAQWAPPPPPQPDPAAWQPLVPPPPPAPEPVAPIAEAPAPLQSSAPVVPPAVPAEPTPIALGAVEAPTSAPESPPPAAPVPEPTQVVAAPTPEPEIEALAEPILDEPVVAEAPRPAPEPTAAADTTDSYRRVEVGLESTRESFFDQPGTWFEEPDRRQPGNGGLKAWASRIASGVGGLVVVIVMLVSIGPKFLPYQTFFVRSGSMHPTFDTGDLIVLGKADAATLRKGDVITFERPDQPGTLVTHRIFAIETSDTGKVFVTKGDANGEPDAWRVPAAGTGWKYNFRLPKLGFVFGYLGTQQARLALLVIPAVILGALSLIDIWKPQPKGKGKAKGSRRR
jgi:signal peptidase